MRLRGLLFGVLLLSTFGCGRVHYVRYVKGVEFDPNVAWGLKVDQAYAVDDVMKLKGRNIMVKVEDPIQTIDRSVSKISNKTDRPEYWKELRKDLEYNITFNLRESGEFAEVQTATLALSTFHPDAILNVAITEWHEGNGFLRAILGIGFGATRMQWEGTLNNARTGKVLFAFADARVHPGGPSMLGLPLRVWVGRLLIQQDLGFGSKDLTKTLRTVI